jgi:Uma2 family endonuclease
MRTAVPCNGNIRYPDIVVDGGDFQPDNLFATLPVLVADVLVSDDDPGSRLDDYKDNDDIYTILLVATDHFHATLHRRGEGEWSEQFFNDLDGTIELAGIGTSLRLSDIYFGLDIAPKSREP